MTRPRLPINATHVSPGRRGRGAGEPAPCPVPPPVESELAGPTSSADRSVDPKVSVFDHEPEIYTPFRLGPGGLVVVILPQQLQAACARRGWSLTLLARRAGISYPTIKSTLRGKAIRPRTAWKLARALGQEDVPPELDRLWTAS